MCPKRQPLSAGHLAAERQDGIAIQLGATSGSGGVTLRKVVDKLDSGGGMISLDIGALTQGHGLTNSMLSITVAGAGGKSLGGAGAIGVNLSRTEVQAVIDNAARPPARSCAPMPDASRSRPRQQPHRHGHGRAGHLGRLGGYRRLGRRG